MEEKTLKLAMGQMLVEPGEPAGNLERAVRMIQKAALQGCRIIVLPECLDLGWTYPNARRMAEPIPGRYSDELSKAAREFQIYVVAGLTEKAGDRLYNAAIFLGPDGQILARHRKINELSIAKPLYSTGNSLSVTETPFGIIGISICADNTPDSLVLGHSLARMGAKLLLSPCSWAVPGNHDGDKEPYGTMWKSSYSTLAKMHEMIVIGVSNTGPIKGGAWDGWKCIGCSLAVGPEGILAQGPYDDSRETLICIEID